ncbi:MAG: ComF family protein [Rhodobacteraceae bacterium]|nr:ComF family protein [Paracoccaceae bacterium]MCP5341362.1 ComF family protein [Paracoccaceae bacterium]
MQNLLRMIFPPQCINCKEPVASEYGLCAACWHRTPFVTGLACDKCGIPLLGEDEGTAEFCDDCITIARPWDRGRAAFLYRDIGRRLVLAIKHGDRLDLVRPAGDWLARAATPILRSDMLVAPVPIHRMRLLRRRFNQSALLSREMARCCDLEHCPDLLIRLHKTATQDGRSRQARFENVSGAITIHPRHCERIGGRNILLIDDVMTSGATLAASADACLCAGAASVSVVVLARVAKEA